MSGPAWVVPGVYNDEALLRDLVDKGLDRKQVSDTLSVHTGRKRSQNSVRHKVDELGLSWLGDDVPLPNGASESVESEGDQEKVTWRSYSSRIRTVEQLLAKAEIDTSVWEVYWQRIKQYEGYMKDGNNEPVVVPMFAVEVKLRRNREAGLLKALGDEILTEIAKRRPIWPSAPAVVRPGKDRERFLFEPCVMDLHAGKLAWREESGEDYDISITEQVFMQAVEEMIDGLGGRYVEQCLFPVGNDLFQFDNLAGLTTGGTAQDTDTRYAKVFARAEGMMRYAIERLSAVAPTMVKVVPGNHDRQSAFTLGRTLRAWFHGNELVTIDASPRLRKYHRYGVNLIGYTHGSEEKLADLPLIMAQECPQDWAETKFREYHIGHLHKMKETRYVAGDTFNGVRVRIIPSLCATDAWHAMKGYVGGVRSAEAYLWNYETGYAGHIATNVLPISYET